jgi:hypothetical protein
MTPETLNTILILIFVAVILLTLLGGIIGFFKGIYKTALKSIVKTILTVILIFLSPTFAVLLGNINIQGIVHSDSSITFQTYLANLITDTGFFSPVNAISVYSTAFAISTSLISFGVFFMGMVLIELFSSLLTGIIYNGIFRWFLPVETKKQRRLKKKNKNLSLLKNGLVDEDGKVLDKPKKSWPLLRIPGALLGAIQEFVFVVILLSPLTVLASTAINNQKGIDNVLSSMDVDQENITLFDSYLKSVDDSLIYKMISNSRFDSLIIDRATQVTVQGNGVSFSKLVDSTFELANPLLENGTISYDKASKSLTINYATLMSFTTVDSILDTIVANPMLLALVPPLIDSAITTASGNFFALNQLDFTKVDVSSDISLLKDIYSLVYDSGVKPLIDGTDINVNNYVIKVSQFSDEDISDYVGAVRKFGQMDSVKNNLAVIFSSLGIVLNSKGLDIFPTEVSAYSSIDWSEDLSTLVNIVLRLFRLLNMDIKANMDVAAFKENLMSCLQDKSKREEIHKYICSSDDFKGLLDTSLFSVLSVPNILKSTFSSIPSIFEYTQAIDYEKILGSYDRNDYKKEFDIIFSMMDLIFAEDSKIDLTHIIQTDLSDEETVQQLVRLLNIAKESSIFSSMYSPLMKSLLFNNDFMFDNYLFGLTPYNFNYDSENFIEDFTNLLSLMPSIQKMIRNITDSSLTREQKIESLDVDTIERLLLIVTSSDFFNSDQMTGASSQKQKNVNIHTLLTNLFNSDMFSKLQLDVPDVQSMSSIRWETTSQGRGEVSILCQILEDLKKNPKLFSSSSSGLKDVEDTDALADMVKTGLDSKLFSDSILKIIDQSLNQYLEKIGFHLTLSEMRNELWKEDCDEIADILFLLKGMDEDDFDLLTIPVDRLNALLTALYQTNMIQSNTTYSDPFGYVIYTFCQKQGFSSLFNISNLDLSLFELTDTTQWSAVKTKVEFTNEDSLGTTKSIDLTSEGEIWNLCSLVKLLQAYGKDIFSRKDVPLEFFDDLSQNVNSVVIRRLLSRILGNMVSSMDVPDVLKEFVSSIDFSLMESMSETEAKKELLILKHLYQFTKKNDKGGTYFSILIEDFYQLSSNESILNVQDDTKSMEDDLYQIIDELTSSKLMTSTKVGYTLSPIQNFLSTMIKKMNLTDGVTLMENESLKDASLKSILLQIDQNNLLEEMNSLKSIIHQLQGLSSNLEIGKTLTKDKASLLLEEMNSSILFHRYPISLIKQSFERLDLVSYVKDPHTLKVLHPLEYLVHLGTSAEDISYWKNDIECLLNVAYDTNGISSLFTSDLSLSSLKFDSSSLSLHFIYYLGKMNLLSKSRSYLVYNLINHSVDDNHSLADVMTKAKNAPYGENESVYRLEELYFQNPKLLDSNGQLDETKALHDLDMLQNVLSLVVTKMDQLSNDLDPGIDFAKLMSDTLEIDSNGIFYRSDLCSELVAGGLSLLDDNPNYISYLTLLKSDPALDFYSDDYFLVNPVEGDGLNAIVKLINRNSTATYFSYEELLSLAELLGREDSSSLSDSNVYDYFRKDMKYTSQGCNSYIGMKLISYLGSLPVKKKVDSSIVLLSSLLDLSSTDFATKSLESLVLGLSDIIE